MSEEIQHDPSGASSEASELIAHIENLSSAEPVAGDDGATKPATRQTIGYAILSVSLGLLAGGGFAAMAIHPAERTGSLDMGQVAFNPAGLRGHLVLNWNKKLEYRLAVEPSDPALAQQFAQTIATPPRPLSVGIQLKDAEGYVLCIKTIDVKFDPLQAETGAQPGNLPAATPQQDQQEQKEVARERGMDVFQIQNGSDGQIQSITAAGEIPCSNQNYASTKSWSFSPDFPSVEDQAALLKQHADSAPEPTVAMAEPPALHAAANARHKAKKKSLDQPSGFGIEGDDELVGIDPARGIAKTTTSISFQLSPATAKDAADRLQELPETVHYKCDLNNSCTLTRHGAVVLTAQLRR